MNITHEKAVTWTYEQYGSKRPTRWDNFKFSLFKSRMFSFFSYKVIIKLTPNNSMRGPSYIHLYKQTSKKYSNIFSWQQKPKLPFHVKSCPTTGRLPTTTIISKQGSKS